MCSYTPNYGKIDEPIIMEPAPSPYVGCPPATKKSERMAQLLLDALEDKWFICKVQREFYYSGSYMEKCWNIEYFMDNCGQVWKIFLDKISLNNNPYPYPANEHVKQFEIVTDRSDIPLTDFLIDLAKGTWKLFYGRTNHNHHSRDTAVVPTKDQFEMFMKPAADMWNLWNIVNDDYDYTNMIVSKLS